MSRQLPHAHVLKEAAERQADAQLGFDVILELYQRERIETERVDAAARVQARRVDPQHARRLLSHVGFEQPLALGRVRGQQRLARQAQLVERRCHVVEDVALYLLKRAREEVVAARAALNLSAGRLGERPRLDEHDRVDV